MVRSLNEFEKSLLANHPHFYASLDMAARQKARYIKGASSIPGYSTAVLTNAKVVSNNILKNLDTSPLKEPKEFAKMFLQFHTSSIEVGSGNVALDITSVVTTEFVGEGGDFEVFLDDVFKLLSE